MSPARSTSRSTAIAAAATTVLILGASGAHAAQRIELTERYVALGDSFTAGPLIPEQHGDPALCLRSSQNYPSVVAEALGVGDFQDASCSGAVLEDMSEPQELLGPDNPAQLDALTKDTSLVTLGIGGNDVGYAEIVITCALLSATDPNGEPCRDHYANGGDELHKRIDRTAGGVAEVLEAIQRRSPQARVAVVGYLRILPESAGCWPKVPVAEGDVAYLDGVQTDINKMLEEEAAQAGAVFVDVSERGHDVCQSPEEKWVEGIFPTDPAAPVHPNARGMAEVGSRVVEVLGAQPVERAEPLV